MKFAIFITLVFVATTVRGQTNTTNTTYNSTVDWNVPCTKGDDTVCKVTYPHWCCAYEKRDVTSYHCADPLLFDTYRSIAEGMGLDYEIYCDNAVLTQVFAIVTLIASFIYIF